MFMANKNSLARPSHSMLLVVFLQPLETGKDRGILLWLVFFGAECVVAKGEESNGLRLVRREGQWDNWTGHGG